MKNTTMGFAAMHAMKRMLVATCVGFSFASSAAEPAVFPTKPIRWIVGYAPGGSVDVVTRVVAKEVGTLLKTSVIVENKPGATGGLALTAATKSDADGYTLITVPGPVVTAQPRPELGKELVGVAGLASGAMVLVGPSSAPTKDLQQLLQAIKSDPSQYSYATGGTGTSQHLGGELINQLAGVRMVHVPYKGGGQAVTDVVGGQVQLAVLGTAPLTPHIKSGRLRAYGVSTATRVESLPDVPTLAEAGIPNFEATQWFLVAAPAGVTADRLAKLGSAVSEALTHPSVKEVLLANGMNALVLTAQQTLAYSRAEQKKWQDLAKDRKLELE